MVNPYESTAGEPEPTTQSSEVRGLRAAIYLHVGAIMGCTLLTLTDTGMIRIGSVPSTILWFFSMPLVMCWFICPVITSLVVWRAKQRSILYRTAVTIIACLLSTFQLWVCLPLVQ